MTYGVKGEVPEEEYTIPLGKADVKRAGSDVTIVSWGKQVVNCLTAGDTLAKEGIDCEVVDLRTLRPLDQEAIFASVAKTASRGRRARGPPLRWARRRDRRAHRAKPCFDFLDGPVLRVANREVPQPYATNLEKLVVPNPERIVAAVRDTLGRS
jgi:pyruvate dehydrogenase E1 component beta subunit